MTGQVTIRGEDRDVIDLFFLHVFQHLVPVVKSLGKTFQIGMDVRIDQSRLILDRPIAIGSHRAQSRVAGKDTGFLRGVFVDPFRRLFTHGFADGDVSPVFSDVTIETLEIDGG